MTSLTDELRKRRKAREKDKGKQKEAARIRRGLPTLKKGKTTAVVIPKRKR